MATTTAANIGTHSISVVLTDADAKFSNYAFQLKITEAPVVKPVVEVIVVVPTAASTASTTSTTNNAAAPASVT